MRRRRAPERSRSGSAPGAEKWTPKGAERQLKEMLDATDRRLRRLVATLEEARGEPESDALMAEIAQARLQLRRNRETLTLMQGAVVERKVRDKLRYQARYPDDWVDASELDNAQQTALGEPASVPIVELIREQPGLWRPEDYARLPTAPFHAPGFTLLEGAFLNSPGHALLEDGRFVEDRTTRLLPAPIIPGFEQKLKLGAAARSGWHVADSFEKGILASGPGVRMYGHMLVDFLPALAILDQYDAFTDWPVLLSADTPRWALPMLKAFSGRPREIKWFSQRGDELTQVDELCVPWVLRESLVASDDPSAPATGAFHPDVANVFERIRRAATRRKGAAAPARRIYVQRAPSWDRRPLTNSEEIEAAFEARAFELVSPEKLRFVDQVRLFAGAEVVAGEGGSGLHGVAFSPPGTITLEIRPPRYEPATQPGLAVIMGQGFASLAGDYLRGPQEPWRLEPAAVEASLAEVGI